MPAEAEFQAQAFGKYVLMEHIATGGMAEIFRSISYGHGGFEKRLVIKRILEKLERNEGFISMFVDEAKLSAQLTHSNIVQVIDFGRIKDRYFIAMEEVNGQDLRSTLKRLVDKERLMPPDFVAYVMHEAAAGLDYAHSKKDRGGRPLGIVHRDISPSNILLSYEGEVKVADFGIAMAQAAGNDGTGKVAGKFDYMSPEQARGEDLDGRSDLFSLGIVMWETLTCRRLFRAGTLEQTLARVQRAQVPVPSSLNERVPAELDRICLKLLGVRKEERYQSGEELEDDLLRFMLPQTPSRMKRLLARMLEQLFEREIAASRLHLSLTGTQASMVAQAAEREADFMEEQNTQPGLEETSPPQQPAVREVPPWPWIAASSILALLLITLLILLWQS